jgi:hypothetical protein
MLLKVCWLQAKQHTEPLAYIDKDVSWSLRLEDNSASVPIEIFDVVRENNTGDLPARRQRDFKRVALRVTGNRACYGEARFRVVGSRREDQGWTPPALLVTGLRIKR